MKRYKLLLEECPSPAIGKLTSSQDCRNKLIEGWERLGIQEAFYVLALNQDNQVLDKILLNLGSVTACSVDLKILFSRLLLLPGCTAFIVAHNHPSGNVIPSVQDENLTARIAKAANLLDFRLLDHIILTGANEKYYSFADNGKII